MHDLYTNVHLVLRARRLLEADLWTMELEDSLGLTVRLLVVVVVLMELTMTLTSCVDAL